MKPTKQHIDSDKFVAQHYKRGAFSEHDAWQRLNIAPVVRKWYRSRLVASVAVMAVLAASACIYYVSRNYTTNTTAPTTLNTPQSDTTSANRVVVIEFNDAPLTEVVATIEKEYGVIIVNIPAEDYKLTLRYEGTATDLINTINELLNTNLTIADE
jgi:hypothetical protein